MAALGKSVNWSGASENLHIRKERYSRAETRPACLKHLFRNPRAFVVKLQKLGLKFISFQVRANHTRPTQARARDVSCSFVQIHRPGAVQLWKAFKQASSVPRTHSTPMTPNTVTQVTRPLIAAGSFAADRAESQPTKNTTKRMHTKRTTRRNRRSDGLRSSGLP